MDQHYSLDLLNYAATLIQKMYKGFIIRKYMKKLQKHLYFENQYQTINEYGFCIQPTRASSIKSKHSCKPSHQKTLSKYQMNKFAIRIQKNYRGYMSRKYICEYRKLKAIVLFLEGHIHYYLRKRIQERKISIKQFHAQCYNFQSQCRQIAQNRVKLCKFMNQKQFDQVNGILFTSFLNLMIPNFEKLNGEQKGYYVEQLLSVCGQQPPAKKNSKTPLKQRQVIQNISVLSQEVFPSSTSSTKQKAQLTNEEFKNLLFQQRKKMK